MSVYRKENPKFLKESIDSMLNQTVLTDDFIIMEDGALTNELEDIVKYYEGNYDFIHVYRRKQNLGLGLTLMEGVKLCKNEVICRMDSDDYSIPERCEKELRLINMGYSLVGSDIAEFEGSVSNIIVRKKMPHTYKAIYDYAKYRNPFNHSTVMFRKDTILKAGNYRHLPKLEDYDLWSRVLMVSKKCANIQEELVYMRINDDFYKRRGGKENLQSHLYLRKEMLKRHQINIINYLLGCGSIIIRFICPNRLKGYIYKVVLRKNVL